MDKDLVKMFKEKNRAILITNLKFDLEKNINSLLDTVTNIFNLEFDTAIKKIIAILEDSEINNSNKFITDSINNMKMKSYNSIDELLNSKKSDLIEKINNLEFEEECLNEYYDTVLNTTKEFKEKLKEISIMNVQEEGINLLNEFVLKNKNESKDGLTLSRINDYLSNRLYGKLETKVHMEIMLRDNNLINKAKESYLRFQEITNKTIKN